MARTGMFALLVGLMALVVAPVASAGPAAEALIERSAADLATGDASGQDLVSLIDTPRVARFTLGRHARTLPDEDIARYTVAFDRAMRRALQMSETSLSSSRVEVVGSVDRNERDSIVTTRVSVPGHEAQTVRWRVIERDGAWRVVDIEALGIWLAIEQRAQVSAILGRRGAGIDDVIGAFDRHLARLETAEGGRG